MTERERERKKKGKKERKKKGEKERKKDRKILKRLIQWLLLIVIQ